MRLYRSSAQTVPDPSRLRHGHARKRAESPTYQSWEAMRRRCTKPRCAGFKNYGGRGITVCDRWQRSFENFLADMDERPEGTTIDRIDNDLGYFKANCRWATDSEQRRNRRQD